jgi:HPt (histidine-containing phosphotransfer) domain-containing protein
VRRAAHSLKSNAATFGAGSLAALCAELEGCAQAGRLSDGTQRLRRIEESWSAARDELAAVRGQLDGG